ncbi:MAG TPA: antibiotic biosynthesis monooxygenase [Candidatus Lustribacter sp.]|nr:antibiotic biosynthesis monooxygenase [Candidatus Lustribacter sp.]
MAAGTVFPQKKGATTIGINVFATPRERHGEMLETLGAIADLADSRALPKNRYSSFHPAIDAPIVVNYVQYADPTGGRELAAVARPLVERTHELSTSHEMRYYDAVEVVTAGGRSEFAVVAGTDTVAVISVYVVEPGKQPELMDALQKYAEIVKSAGGFEAISVLQGQKPEHAAAYEVWADIAAYRRSATGVAAEALARARALAGETLIEAYTVVRVNRHRGA